MLNGTESQSLTKELDPPNKELPELKMGPQERFFYSEQPQVGQENYSLNFSYPGQTVPGFGVSSPGRFLSPVLSNCTYGPVRPQAAGTNGYSVPVCDVYSPAGVSTDSYPSPGEGAYSSSVQHLFPRGPHFPVPGYQASGKLQVVLNNYPLWAKFHKQQTEMIITKQGRRMFPFLSFNISGLDPATHYNIYVDIVLADQHHWRYQGGKWVQCGKAEGNMPGNRIYMHPDSPNTGAHWMRQEISFGKLKLTNNKGACNNVTQMVVLQSLHKYQPRLHVTEVKEGEPDEYPSSKTQTFCFLETQFIAVTAYQNADITQLKIDHNPFAKGFRDNFDSMYTTAEGDRLTPSPTDTSGCQQFTPGTRYQAFLHEQYPLPQGRFYNGERSSPHALQQKDPLGTSPPRWYFTSQQASAGPLEYNTYDAEYSGNKFVPYGVKPFPLQSSAHHALTYYQEHPFDSTASWGGSRSSAQYHPRPSTGTLSWFRPVRDLRHLPPSSEKKSKDSDESSTWADTHSGKSLDSSGPYEADCKRRRLSPYTSSCESSPVARSGDQCEKEGTTEGSYYNFYST
ncbi:T-box transcription factor TBX21 [Rhinatrema bivittatum]|uniref:T-box transcription factor TBX21 n=1 Tax=Rhinatrema bivittatum TaxID=194408 RepID=UPI00112B7835|nr:T-box transcription factor TBX21 [Rhinatrema bivittatum]